MYPHRCLSESCEVKGTLNATPRSLYDGTTKLGPAQVTGERAVQLDAERARLAAELEERGKGHLDDGTRARLADLEARTAALAKSGADKDNSLQVHCTCGCPWRRGAGAAARRCGQRVQRGSRGKRESHRDSFARKGGRFVKAASSALRAEVHESKCALKGLAEALEAREADLKCAHMAAMEAEAAAAVAAAQRQ
eukprot:3192256-Pyramimonas_sp.AAC.2